MMSSQVINLVVPSPDPELPEPELLAVVVDVLWIFHSPFWRTTSILVVPWIAFSLRSQTSLFGFSEYRPPVGRALFAGSNAPAVTSNCMILLVLSKSVEFGTP